LTGQTRRLLSPLVRRKRGRSTSRYGISSLLFHWNTVTGSCCLPQRGGPPESAKRSRGNERGLLLNVSVETLLFGISPERHSGPGCFTRGLSRATRDSPNRLWEICSMTLSR